NSLHIQITSVNTFRIDEVLSIILLVRDGTEIQLNLGIQSINIRQDNQLKVDEYPVFLCCFYKRFCLFKL
ncbi:MAG: hypothetical protein M3Y53_00670, partial [Thermoproteota archaeon]|nr:hypothetical protein [Thermoproteota archaeon]